MAAKLASIYSKVNQFIHCITIPLNNLSKVIFGPNINVNWKLDCLVTYNREYIPATLNPQGTTGGRRPELQKRMGAILKKYSKKKVVYWSEMVRNAIESDFRSSKMAQIGLPKWPLWKKTQKKSCVLMARNAFESGSEMVRNAIESDFRSSKMAQIGLPKWPLWKKNSKKKVLYWWREMHSKVIFGHPKWPSAAILWKKNQSWVLIWNGEKCDQKRFWVIQNGRRQPFCEKKSKLRVDLKWQEMRSKVVFGQPKWPLAAILQKNKSCVLIWNGEKCYQKWFSVIQNGRCSHFVKKKKLRIDLKWWEMRSKVIFGHPKWPLAAILWKKSCVLIWNGEKCDQKWFSVIQNGRCSSHFAKQN